MTEHHFSEIASIQHPVGELSDLRTKALPLPVSAEHIQRLRQGEYLNVLSTYAVSWGLERCARDLNQNFFDPFKSLDNLVTSVDEIRLAGSSGVEYLVTLWSPATYDFRKLLHIGGSDKTGDPTVAGGFGEGTKITSLVLLRDFGVRDIRFSSKGWNLEFYLTTVPEGEYDTEATGLFARLSDNSTETGNALRFIVPSREIADAFVQARDLFYHSANPDFLSPTMVVEHSDFGKSGFTFLGRGDYSLNCGNFYDAGQRRHYVKESDGWTTVEGVHLWTLGRKAFGTDRERGPVSREEIRELVINPMIKAMSDHQLSESLHALQPIWDQSKSYFFETANRLLEAIVLEASHREIPVSFDSMYVAGRGFVPIYIRESLTQAGYTICCECFSQLGMMTANEKFNELQVHYRIEPTTVQLQQMDILQEASSLIGQSLLDGEKHKAFDVKPIWLFNHKEEKNISIGQYHKDFTWLATSVLQSSFPRALATFLHELDHVAGTDQSAEFSYALTDTLELVIDAIERQPEKFRELRDRWAALVGTR